MKDASDYTDVQAHWTTMKLLATMEPFVPFAGEVAQRITFEICRKALALVGGDRREDYDHPVRNLGLTVEMVQGALNLPDFDVHDFVNTMVCVKLAREHYKAKEDNLVDIVGYAVCGDICETHREGTE